MDPATVAFEPGQQIKCKTRFNEIYTGEVVAFDLQNQILIFKSASSSGNSTTKDLHFLVLSNVADIEVLEESQGDCAKFLPNIEMKFIEGKKATALNERMILVEAIGNGVSQDGISLFVSLSKKYEPPSDLTWKDKTHILVMNSVVIKPPYKETDCELTNPKSADALNYVRSIVRKFWENP